MCHSRSSMSLLHLDGREDTERYEISRGKEGRERLYSQYENRRGRMMMS